MLVVQEDKRSQKRRVFLCHFHVTIFHQSFISSSRGVYKLLLGEVRGTWSVSCSASECWTSWTAPCGQHCKPVSFCSEQGKQYSSHHAASNDDVLQQILGATGPFTGLSCASRVSITQECNCKYQAFKDTKPLSCQIVSEMFRHFQMTVLWGLFTEQIYFFACSEKA